MITRAMAVMRAVRDSTEGLSLSGISSSVALPRSTVQRIVHTLAIEGVLMPTARRNGWVLGPEATSMTRSEESGFVSLCRPTLMEISSSTGETADLSAFKSTYMLFLDQCPGSHRLRTVGKVGGSFPLTTTANGRASLSLLADEQVKELACLEWSRSDTNADLKEFMRMIGKVRSSGFSYDLDEHTEGISAVGIPLADMHGVPHAISVPAPSTRFREEQGSIERALLAASRQVKRLLAMKS